MRILFVTPYVPSPIRVRPYHFIRQLAARHDVAVVTLHQGERERSDVDHLRGICPTVAVSLPRSRSLINCLRALPTGVPLQGAYCRSPELSRVVRGALAPESADGLPPELRGGFDVVHVEHLRAAYLGETLPAGVPSVIDSVDCISLLLARTRRRSHRVSQRMLAAFELSRTPQFERRALTRFDRVLVTSPVDAAALRTLDARMPTVEIANGVALEQVDAVDRDVDSDADTIVFAGKMSYHANVTAAILFARGILPRVRARRPSARFCIVGSAPPAEVRALAALPGVTVTGYVPDVRPYVTGARVAVAPMVVKVGIQNKILEAMAVGTPVVATSAGAEGLRARPERELLVGDDPAELARQVLRVMEDDDLARHLACAGRTYVETYHSWHRAADALEDVYQAAIDARRGRASFAGANLRQERGLQSNPA